MKLSEFKNKLISADQLTFKLPVDEDMMQFLKKNLQKSHQVYVLLVMDAADCLHVLEMSTLWHYNNFISPNLPTSV